MDPVQIGSTIAKLRKERKLTQKMLAQKLMISDRTVSKWERGGGIPDISLLQDVATLLQVQLEFLLADDGLASRK